MTQENDKWEHIDEDISQVDNEMDGAEDFEELTDEVFDNILKQYVREQRVHTISPQKNITPNPKDPRPGGSRSRKLVGRSVKRRPWAHLRAEYLFRYTITHIIIIMED